VQPTVEELLAGLEMLDRHCVRGDVRPRDYARRHAALVEELARAKVRPLLEGGEKILAEHYVVRGHFKLTQSLLQETPQEVLGFLATDRRLFRWRFQQKPSPGADELPDVANELEGRWYGDLSGMERRRDVRWSEALTGLAILIVAVVLWPFLEVVGPLMLLTGLAGIGHALLLPTPWVAVIGSGEAAAEWRIDAPQKPSGRRVLAVMESCLTDSQAHELRKGRLSYAASQDPSDRIGAAGRRGR